MPDRPKLVYAVSVWDEAGHLAHLPRFLRELEPKVDVCLLIGKTSRPPKLNASQVLVAAGPDASALEMVLGVLRAVILLRRQGYRTYFVRISTLLAILLGLLSTFLRLDVYFWHCGQAKNVVPPWGPGLKRLAHRIRWQLGQWSITWAALLSRAFVTGTPLMVEYYRREYGIPSSKTVIQPNEVDVAELESLSRKHAREELRRELGWPEDVPVVLFLSRVSPLKGGPYIIPIAEKLKESVDRFVLCVVGPIYMEGWLEEVKARRVEAQVKWVGSLPHSQAIKCYLACDLFINPSNSEGFPRVILEAMSLGAPFVSFDVGGIADIIPPEYKPFLTPVGDVAGMARNAGLLLSDPELRRKLSAAGRRQAGHFSTERAAQRFLDNFCHAN